MSNSVKLLPAVAVGNVNVQFPVSVSTCNVPLAMAMVYAVEVFAVAVFSVYACKMPWSISEVVDALPMTVSLDAPAALAAA